MTVKVSTQNCLVLVSPTETLVYKGKRYVKGVTYSIKDNSRFEELRDLRDPDVGYLYFREGNLIEEERVNKERKQEARAVEV